MARGRLIYLSAAERKFIHEQTARVLAEVGIGYNSPAAIELLAAAGADVDRELLRAKLPWELVERCLATCPREIRLAARDPRYDVMLGDGSLAFCSDGTGTFMLDDVTGRRTEGTAADMRQTMRLLDALPEVDYTWPPISARDLVRIALVHERGNHAVDGAEDRALPERAAGHIMDLSYHAGQHVAAGAVIARINGITPSHLHFSIHPGTHYLDNNPWAGSVPKSWLGYDGFGDPVKFLKTHPRVIRYLPPALPLTTIATDSVASDVGAVAGVAYWTEQTAHGPVACSCDLATGARAVLATGTSAPAFDTARYVVALPTPPATGFTVSDRRPVLIATVSSTTPAWGAAVTVRGRLLNAAGRPFQGARLVLERRSGGGWLRASAAPTTSDGRLALAWTPSRRTALRLRYVPPGQQPAGAAYLALSGAAVGVTPHVSLTRPSLPAGVIRGRTLTVAGRLEPSWAGAPRTVTLVFERRVDGVYATARTRRATIRGNGSSARWTAVVKPTAVGDWRVRALYCGDADYAATVGPWRAFSVR